MTLLKSIRTYKHSYSYLDFMMKIPTPPGTKDNPLYKKCRLVAANSNPAVIIGIPKQIVELGQIIAGEEFKIYMEFTDTSRKHYRIVMEK